MSLERKSELKPCSALSVLRSFSVLGIFEPYLKPAIIFTVVRNYGTKIVTYGTYVLLFASSIWFLTGRNRQSILFVVYELKAPTQEARNEL